MNNVISISDARNTLPSLVKKLDEGAIEEVHILSHKKIKAVLVNPEYLESLKETAEILAIPGMLESIKQGEQDMKHGRGITLEQLLEEMK